MVTAATCGGGSEVMKRWKPLALAGVAAAGAAVLLTSAVAASGAGAAGRT